MAADPKTRSVSSHRSVPDASIFCVGKDWARPCREPRGRGGETLWRWGAVCQPTKWGVKVEHGMSRLGMSLKVIELWDGGVGRVLKGCRNMDWMGWKSP